MNHPDHSSKTPTLLTLKEGGVTLVDAEDYERVSPFKWYEDERNNVTYVAATIGGKTVKLHRFIMGVTDPKIQVDHWDCNGLNNQKSNLRVATQSQNLGNMRLSKANTTGYKGISWSKIDEVWQADIKKNGKTTYLGSFPNPESAARAYDDAARQYFGPFARLNFPNPGEVSVHE